MAKRVAMFLAADGKYFTTEKEALEHEAKAAVEGGVNTLLSGLKLETAVISTGEGEDVFLSTWLLDNRAALVDALTGAKAKTTKTRKPRGPSKKTLDKAAATASEAVTAAEGATVSSKQKVEGAKAETLPATPTDDLDALLASTGGEAAEQKVEGDAGQSAEELLSELE